MKRWLTTLLISILIATTAFAKEPDGGLKPGGFLAPFNVVKLGGASEDEVEVGEELCYRSRNGQKPQVIIFSRDASQLATLAEKLDAWADKSEGKGRAFINVLGETKDGASENAKKFSEKQKLKRVAVVVPERFKDGPEQYKLDPKAKHTVILADRGRVVVSFQSDDLQDKVVDEIVKAVEKQLKP